MLTLADTGIARGGTWGPDDTIIYMPNPTGGLWRVPAEGGTPERLTTVDPAKGELNHRWPHVLPDGKAVLFANKISGSMDQAEIAILSLETGEIRALLSGGTYPRYVPSGHVVFGHSGTLMAFPFDPETLERTGSPGPVINDLSTNNVVGGAAYAFSNSGLLVYAPSSAVVEMTRSLVWVDRAGQHTAGRAPKGYYDFPKISPDGTRIALTLIPDDGTRDIRVFDIARETMTRLTFEGTNVAPQWTPDGKRIIFGSDRDGSYDVYWKPADGSGPAERISATELMRYPVAISADGSALALAQIDPETGRDIWVMSMDGDRAARPFVEGPFDETNPTFAPDARWIAYSSTESGRPEVYVRPYPGPGGKWQVSRDGGSAPIWSHDGTKIYFRNGAQMIGVSVSTDSGFSAGTPELIFEGNFAVHAARNYDLAPGDDRFLMIENTGEQESVASFRVITNWFADLERLVPTGGN